MKTKLFASAALLALPLTCLVSSGAQAAVVFPKAGQSTNGAAVVITLTDNGPTLQTLSSQTYDGSDDAEVGLINNSSTTQTSFTLSGSGNGGGLFAFDGDGIQNYTDANTGALTIGNPSDPTGYAGPGVTFSNISGDATSGQVNFSLAPGASTYFSLESSPASINQGGGISIGGGGGGGSGGGGGGGGGGGTGTTVPEPASALLLLAGLSSLGLVKQARGRTG